MSSKTFNKCYNLPIEQKKEVFIVQYNKRIRDAREDSDKLQKDIAEQLGITTQQYQLYESGKRKLPIDHLITLCRFYNLSADSLLGLTDTPRRLK